MYSLHLTSVSNSVTGYGSHLGLALFGRCILSQLRLGGYALYNINIEFIANEKNKIIKEN